MVDGSRLQTWRDVNRARRALKIGRTIEEGLNWEEWKGIESKGLPHRVLGPLTISLTFPYTSSTTQPTHPPNPSLQRRTPPPQKALHEA